MSKNNLVLVLCLLGLTSLAQAEDLSVLQTAARIAQDNARNAREERDADAQHMSEAEKELEQQKQRLEAARKKASQSEARYLDSKKKYDQAQAALDRAWKQQSSQDGRRKNN